MTHKRMFAVGLGGGYIKLVLSHKPPEAVKTSTTKDVTVTQYGLHQVPNFGTTWGEHDVKKKLHIKTIYWKGGRSLGVYRIDDVTNFLVNIAGQPGIVVFQFVNVTRWICWEVPHEIALLLNKSTRARLRREL